jgi:parallel beta-helix repeat protein
LLGTEEDFAMRACSIALKAVAVIAVLSFEFLEDTTWAAGLPPAMDAQPLLDRARAGSTVTLEDGVYSGGLIIRNSGTAASPITVKARNPHKAIVRGGPAVGKKGQVPNGITVSGNFIILDGLRVEDAPGNGIHIAGKHVTVRRCVLYHNGWSFQGEKHGGEGILTAGPADDARLEENECYKNREHGIYISAGSKRPLIIGNSLHENGDPKTNPARGSGLQINADGAYFPTSGAIVRGNKLYSNLNSGISLQGVHDSLLVNNLLYDNHHYATLGVSKASRSNRFVNNTIVAGKEKGRVAIAIFGGDKRGPTTGNLFFNNIIVAESGVALSIENGVTPSDIKADHNLFWAGGKSHIAKDDDSGKKWTLAEWQALGRDASSLHADPRFVEAGRDFHLTSESPARGLGMTHEDVKDDVEKAIRPKDKAISAGAHEFRR